MGWLFSHTWNTRDALIAELRSRFNGDAELVKACVSGNRHWYLAKDRRTGMHFIGLDLLRRDRRNGWGYKDMDESCAPYAYDCPISYLDAPHTPREGYAAEWREKVRQHHAKKKTRPAYTEGLQLTLGTGWVYTLLHPADKRRGWIVSRNDGTQWRMPFAQLARAELVK
jgi:hypothetical protein